MDSADFPQFIVTVANEAACETSLDKSVFFPCLSSQLVSVDYDWIVQGHEFVNDI